MEVLRNVPWGRDWFCICELLSRIAGSPRGEEVLFEGWDDGSKEKNTSAVQPIELTRRPSCSLPFARSMTNNVQDGRQLQRPGGYISAFRTPLRSFQ